MQEKLNEIQKQLVECLRAYICNEQPADMLVSKSTDSFIQLCRLAAMQKLVPILCSCGYVKNYPEVDANIIVSLKRTAKQQSMKQLMHSANFAYLYETIRSIGVEPVVVKGVVSRSLYREDCVRPSGDEDILVKECDFIRCHELLLSEGYRPINESFDIKNAPVIGYSGKNGLHIEMHRRLFDEANQSGKRHNVYFCNADSQLLKVMDESDVQLAVRTFLHTDNLYYMILHALKHFISGGFGIRTASDIGLYAKKYGEEIDLKKLKVLLYEDSALSFASAVFDICKRYLGISGTVADWFEKNNPADGENMLLDILEGGVYGTATESRMHSANITIAAANGKGKTAGLRRSLFPPYSTMAAKYPYVKKHPILLPAAWFSRCINYFCDTLKNRSGDNSASEAVSIGTKRLTLLEEYRVIGKRQY